jgi:hypothetical protein
MKYKFLKIITFLLFCFSCKEKEYLEANFRNEILKFQDKFPLQKKEDSVFPFYALSFRKIKNDTIFYISRYYVGSKVHFESNPIFEDEKLKPTQIFDFDNLTKRIVREYPESKKHTILKFPRAKHVNPTHTYKMNGSKTVFIKEENY